MTNQNNKEILLNYSKLGTALEEYYGAVRKKYFATDIRKIVLSPDMAEGFSNLNSNGKTVFLSQYKYADADNRMIFEDTSLGFVIETHNRPFSSDSINTQPSIELVDNLKRLFSTDEDEKKKYMVEILNSKLTSMRVKSSDLMNALDKVSEIDPDAHPATKMSVASAFAKEAENKEYKSIKQIFTAADKKEQAELYKIYKVLNKSNEGIYLITDDSGCSTIAISGENIDVAIEKLIVGSSLISPFIDGSFLSDGLRRERIVGEKLHEDVAKTLRVLDKYGPNKPEETPKLRP